MPADQTVAQLVDAVHAALRCGDFGALPGLTVAVEAAVHAGALPRDTAGMQALRRKLERNDACLMASARGLRAARRRIAEIASAKSGLQTYDMRGQRQRIAPGTGDGKPVHRF